MRRLAVLILAGLCFAGCRSPFDFHVHVEGKGKVGVHTDGAVFAARAVGEIKGEIGVTDKAQNPVWPPTGLFTFVTEAGEYLFGIDVTLDDDPATPEDERLIGYEAAAKLLGIESE